MSQHTWRQRIVRAPFRLFPTDVVVRVPFGPMRGLRWMPASMPHGAWLGTLERTQLDAFIACARPGMTLWDVGANVGLYAIPSGRAVGPHGRVFAFEPIVRNVEYLRRHIELNGLTSVTVVESAVADITGRLTMEPGDSASEARLATDGPWSVPAVALDDWRATTSTPAPALVKIDVEGAEDRVLLGTIRTLEVSRPILFISLHGERQRLACREILLALDYELASLLPDRHVDVTSEWRADPRGSRRYQG